jgi:tRNA G18 (ribose-2'-O)-methylase SpoU
VDTHRFQIRQCADESCRFRFPAPATITELPCPRCNGPTLAVMPFPERAGSFRKPRGSLPDIEALLDNIRSIYNVGAMLRTADGAGLRRLHLCGITATPDHPRVAKTALGSEDAVPWIAYPNALDAAGALQARGCRLWALESGPQADSLFAVDTLPAAPLVLVVGNELAGVDPALLARCDRVLSIPMQGIKGSLNAAVAFGIAVYHLRFGVPAISAAREKL